MSTDNHVSKKRKYDNPKLCEYPKNLFAAIFEVSHKELTIEINEDRKNALTYVLSTLTPREQEIIRLRYFECKKISEIAQLLDESDKFITFKKNKALRKLQRPFRKKYLEFGIKGYIKEKIKIGVLEQTKKEYERGYKDALLNVLDFIPISLMKKDLSPRLYNILISEGNESVGDILKYDTVDKMLEVPRLGKKSLEELIEKLKKLGFNVVSDIEEINFYDNLDEKNVSAFVETLLKEFDNMQSTLKEFEDIKKLRIKRINEFSYFMKYKLEKKDECVNSYDVVGRVCLSFGFDRKDFKLMEEYKRLFNDYGDDFLRYNEELLEVIYEIHDIDMLGSMIIRKWRDVTHWKESSILENEFCEWFITAFGRLYELTLES